MDLISQLERDEGIRQKAYKDQFGNLTIGVGHTGPEVVAELVWSDEKVRKVLLSDIAKHDADLYANIPWCKNMDYARLGVLRNMCFNMGWHRLSGFVHFLDACQKGLWGKAVDEMKDSVWAEQVGARAKRLETQMTTGVWQ